MKNQGAIEKQRFQIRDREKERKREKEKVVAREGDSWREGSWLNKSLATFGW